LAEVNIRLTGKDDEMNCAQSEIRVYYRNFLVDALVIAHQVGAKATATETCIVNRVFCCSYLIIFLFSTYRKSCCTNKMLQLKRRNQS
jgi:hypothetical protein